MIKTVGDWKKDLCSPAILFLENKYNDSDSISLGQLYLDIREAGLSMCQVLYFNCYQDCPQEVKDLASTTIINAAKRFLNVSDLNSYPDMGEYGHVKEISLIASEGGACKFFYLSVFITDQEWDEYKTNLESLLGV